MTDDYIIDMPQLTQLHLSYFDTHILSREFSNNNTSIVITKDSTDYILTYCGSDEPEIYQLEPHMIFKNGNDIYLVAFLEDDIKGCNLYLFRIYMNTCRGQMVCPINSDQQFVSTTHSINKIIIEVNDRHNTAKTTYYYYNIGDNNVSRQYSGYFSQLFDSIFSNFMHIIGYK